MCSSRCARSAASAAALQLAVQQHLTGQCRHQNVHQLSFCAALQRFAVNPRAAIVQTFSVVSDAINNIFLALEFAPELVDNNNNNDVAAITAIATALADATRSSLGLLTQGLTLRADGMQQMIKNSAGGLATRAGEAKTF